MSMITSKILRKQFVSNCDNAFKAQCREQSGICIHETVCQCGSTFCTIYVYITMCCNIKGKAVFVHIGIKITFNPHPPPQLKPYHTWYLIPLSPWLRKMAVSHTYADLGKFTKDVFTMGHRFCLTQLVWEIKTSENGSEFSSSCSTNMEPSK